MAASFSSLRSFLKCWHFWQPGRKRPSHPWLLRLFLSHCLVDFFYHIEHLLNFSHQFTCLCFLSSPLKQASWRQGHCLHGALLHHRHAQPGPPRHGNLAKDCWVNEWMDGQYIASLSSIYKNFYIYLDYIVVMGRWRSYWLKQRV